MKRLLTIVFGIIILIGTLYLGYRSITDRQLRLQEEQNFQEEPYEVTDFLQKLPKETDHYRIEFDYEENQILIVPKITVRGDENPKDEFARQWSTYEQYAKEALAWMQTEKFDLKAFEIQWWGQEWWPSGKQISY